MNMFVCGGSAFAALVTTASSSSLNPIFFLWSSLSLRLAAGRHFQRHGNLKVISLFPSRLLTCWRRKHLYVHPGARVLKCAPPTHSISPFVRINLESSQTTASKHRSPHSVRVRVGWSALGSTAKTPLNMYQVIRNTMCLVLRVYINT